MKFSELFEKYWDNLIIGIVAGIVLYYGLKIGNAWQSAIYIFTRGLLLILIYTIFVWLGKKYNWDEQFIKLFKNIKNKPFNKKNIINLLFFIFSIIFFTVITLLLNAFNLIHPSLIILSVLLGSLIIFILYFIQKNPKDSLNNISLFLIITTIIVILSQVYISTPQEQPGINLKPLEVKFDFFIVNNEIDKEDLLNYISEANKIWNNYNITISVKSLQNVKINLTDEERKFLYQNISSNENEENKVCDRYVSIINRITNNNLNMGIIYVKGEGTSGRGSLCGHSFAIFQQEKFGLWDLTGWDLAHEIGHVLGLIHPENIYKLNLMNDRYKLFYKTKFLNQKQINIVINTLLNKNDRA